MSDDVVGRSEDFERRMAAAGSTGDIVGGLVKGAERSRQVVKWLTVSLVLDVVLSLSLGVVGIVALHNAKAVEKQTVSSCRQTNKNSVVINQFLDLLITNTRTAPTLTQKQRDDRIAGYRGLIIEIPDCR